MDFVTDYPFIDGLLESTDEDKALFDVLMGGAVPLTALWKNDNDDAKIIQWDASLEKYLDHRREILDYEGRLSNLPFSIYESLNVDWIDGYNYSQGGIGNCTSQGHKNALKASNLVNQKRTGRKAPEIYGSMTYALARGNGRVRNGSGLNLNPMQKWAADVGNFLTSDFGGYDEGRRVHSPTDTELKNARSHQSIIIPLPDTSFETVFSVVSAGFGVSIGTSIYPVASQVNSDGIAIPSSWRKGNHCTAATGGFVENGVEYIWWENSHGNSRYKVGKFGHGSGCALRRADWSRLEGDGFRFGNWYATAGEMPR